MIRVSGDANFKAAGNTVTGQPADPVVQPDGQLGLSDSNGTVALAGLFSSITFTLSPNFGDGSTPDGVFLQVGGTALRGADDLIDGTFTLQSAARTAWRDVGAVAREVAERAIAEAAAGHREASAILQRGSAEVFSGAWSNPSPPVDGDPFAAAAVAYAQESWASAVAARARVAAYVAGARGALERLALMGVPAPPGLADFRDPLAGPVVFCDVGGGSEPFADAPTFDATPLTFAASPSQWGRGDLRFSVDMAAAQLPDGIAAAEGEAVIRSAIDQWQQISVEVAASPTPGFFAFDQVATGQQAELQAIFVEPASLVPPKKPDTDIAAQAQSPEKGIMRFNRRMIPSLDDLRSRTLHEGGHLLGLGHSGVPGTLMFPVDSGTLQIDERARKALAVLYGWLPRRDLTDRATDDRPSLQVVRRVSGHTAEMFWRGPTDNQTIWHAQLTGDSWGPQVDAGVGTSSHSPGLTTVGDTEPGSDVGSRLLMAWKGPDANPGLFWSRQATPDGPFLLNGGATSRRTAFGTSAAPALATLSDRTWMVWKGADNDRQLWYATLDRSSTTRSGRTSPPSSAL